MVEIFCVGSLEVEAQRVEVGEPPARVEIEHGTEDEIRLAMMIGKRDVVVPLEAHARRDAEAKRPEGKIVFLSLLDLLDRGELLAGAHRAEAARRAGYIRVIRGDHRADPARGTGRAEISKEILRRPREGIQQGEGAEQDDRVSQWFFHKIAMESDV